MKFTKGSSQSGAKNRKTPAPEHGTWVIGAAEGEAIAVFTDPAKWKPDKALMEKITARALQTDVSN